MADTFLAVLNVDGEDVPIDDLVPFCDVAKNRCYQHHRQTRTPMKQGDGTLTYAVLEFQDGVVVRREPVDPS